MRARGLERKELLSVISADLDALNASYHNLTEKITILIPCVCSQCRLSLEPEFFEQKRLLHRKEHNRLEVECPSSFEDVDVIQLLDGIKVKHLPAWAEDKSVSGAERTIKIFLASSEELKSERDEFDLFVRQQNDKYRKQGIYLKIIRWENFLDAMSTACLQDEYNQAVCNCDIFVSLFFTKTGKFTEEEFDTAYGRFLQAEKPAIYTFFKNADINTGTAKRDDLNSLWDFQEKLAELGHFYTNYNSIEDLKLQFKDQLEKQLDL